MRKILTPVFAVIDIALLAVILYSALFQQKDSPHTDTPSDDTFYSASDNEFSEDSDNGASDEDISEADDAPGNDPPAADIAPEVDELEADPVAEDDADEESKPGYDPADYDTSTSPTLEDFMWVTPEIYKGNLPDDIERLSFDEVTGSWKAYIITDPEVKFDSMTESFLNASISGSEDRVEITLDWNYTYINSEGSGYDDNSPDSLFTGAWSDDSIKDATGAGKVSIDTFYYDNGHEYAVGSMMWPDGIPAVVFLSRP
ncbi:MAG: hypothetical protein K6F87_08865 [Lachnospiraceae bacterium]|nr:hypothetical protein [Lachnospiraceae bacterium]